MQTRGKLQPRLCSLLICLLLAAPLFAQPHDPEGRSLRFDHISVEQGLSNFSVSDIIQDRQGFLWIATEDGLNKYDGYEFKIFKADPADSNALPGSFMGQLYLDRAENLWVNANGHLCRHNYATGAFEPFERVYPNAKSLSGGSVTRVLEDRYGEFWIGTGGGLYRYDRKRETLRHYRHDPDDATSLSADHITMLSEDRTGQLWIGTLNGGLNRFDREKDKFKRYRHHPDEIASLSSDFIWCVLEDRRGIIWIGTENGLCRYDRRTDRIQRYRTLPHEQNTIGSDRIFVLFEDSQGTLWAGSRHIGLWRYEPAADRFLQYQYDPGKPFSLRGNRIHAIYEDRSGVLWFGHYRAGLSRYVRRQDRFVRHKIDGSVYAIWQDRHANFWIGCQNIGLLHFDRDGKLLAHYRHDPKNPHSLSSDDILAIREDRQGRLWIGTTKGLNLYESNRRRFVCYPHIPTDPTIPEQYEVKAIYEDAEGEMWFGTKGSGLLRWNREKPAFIYHRNLFSVWSITADANGDLWIGGDGLHRFDRNAQTFTSYPRNQKLRQRLTGFVYAVYVDSAGYVWMGTFGGGLYRYDPRADQLLAFTEREGLPDNFVKGILPDSRGNLWLSTDKGLSRFDPRAQRFKNFTVTDGLITNVLLSGAYFKSADGQMYFGGEGGVIAFHPDSLSDSPYLAPVVISSFKVFDKPLPGNSPSQLRTEGSPDLIRLSYRHNFFSFEFVALDFTEPDKNQYAYKLEGFDEDWVYSGKRRYASYTNVDPGEYVFRVNGSNSDGVWNETGASIQIIITPPFWQTWWFRLLALAAISGLAWAAYRYRVNQLVQLERLRTRISADLHDEIAGNLSSIAMFGKIVQDEAMAADERSLAHSEMLQRIISLSQESVNSIREIIWAIDPKPETIHDLLMRVRDFAVNACRAQNMILKFEVLPQAQLPRKNLSPEQRKHLWLLLKEAVTNAVKHSGGTALELRACYENGHLTVSVIDNGAGVSGASNANRFSGKGLGTMKSRAQQLHGALEIFTHPQGGTVVVLSAKI